MPTSLVPPGMTKLPRFVLHPYGRGGIGVTLALYGAGFGIVAYRLYVAYPEQKSSQVLFAGTAKASTEDWAEVAGKILRQLTVRPGDTEGEVSDQLTPEQLSFVLAHAKALRLEAAKRFGWAPEESKPLRADLEAVYSYRRDVAGKRTHRYRVGTVVVEGTTRREAKSGVHRAVLNHCSATPKFKGQYCFFPDGAQWKAQEIPEGPLGKLHTLAAKTAKQAEAEVDAMRQPRRSRRPSAGAFRVSA